MSNDKESCEQTKTEKQQPCYCDETHMHNCPAHTHLQDELISDDTSKTPISPDIRFIEWNSRYCDSGLAPDDYEIWNASRTATLKEILEALPTNKTLEESEFTEHSGTFNECVAEIRAIIEKKLEG